ncbi:hypothetical protein B0H12DRAFT_97692 [Mycena haematopus]|nr:hypothetical protein B0H12DRAFT_97692 [Mycena haematopus]
MARHFVNCQLTRFPGGNSRDSRCSTRSKSVLTVELLRGVLTDTGEQTITSISLAFAATADLTIAAALVVCLRRSRTGIKA